MLRPLGPPSLAELPAAAEAKLEMNGEGIIVVDLRMDSLDMGRFQDVADAASSFDGGLGRGRGSDVIVGTEIGSDDDDNDDDNDDDDD